MPVINNPAPDTLETIRRRRALSEALLGKVMSGGIPSATPGNLWAPFAPGIMAAGAQNRLDEATQQEGEAQERYRKTIADALSPMTTPQNAPPEGQPGPVLPETSRPRTPQEMMQALSQNPDTADYALKMAMMQNRLGAAQPASIQEWLHYSSLPEDKKAEYLRMKRADKILNVGPEFRAVSPTNPAQTTPVAPIGLSPTDQPDYVRNRAVAQRAGAVTGENIAKAEFDLPKVEDAANELLRLTTDLLNHPGKRYAVGMPSLAPEVPGTPQAGFITRWKQIGGKQFMQAYETLKGGGQITEIEGKKATDAMARMSRAQSIEEFDQGVREFQDVVRRGLERAQARAGRGGQPKTVNFNDL